MDVEYVFSFRKIYFSNIEIVFSVKYYSMLIDFFKYHKNYRDAFK